jgi:hypothetical protein
MTDQNQTNSTPATNLTTVSPFRCLTGALISSGFAIALYLLTSSVAQTLAQTPIRSGNEYAMRIAAAVRTLVIGMCALGTGIFTIATLGLLALMVQIIILRWQKRDTPPSDASS